MARGAIDEAAPPHPNPLPVYTGRGRVGARGPGYIRDTIKVLTSLGLSNADMEKICFRNAQKLFGIA